MNCVSLPDTGGPAAFWLGLGLLLLVVGGLLVWRSRRGRSSIAVPLALFIVTAGFVVTVPSPSEAADRCGSSEQSGTSNPPSGPDALVITQTSTIAGLAPDVAPDAIAGTVRNLSDDSTYVTDVTVSISSVTSAQSSPAGVCSAADYVLADPSMSVEQPLPGSSTVSFSGASIGFRNTSENQDACKHATVSLRYVSGSR